MKFFLFSRRKLRRKLRRNRSRRSRSHGALVWFVLALSLSACGGRVMTGPAPTPHSLAISLATPTVLPTLRPRALTPAPTNTPAPTPTPSIHIVQPGDTLLGIALQYGVTLEELYQVNGVLKPELLQIGQSIIIPVPGSVGRPANDNSGAVLAPTQLPLPVNAEHTARYQTPVGSIWVLGEIYNSTAQPVENVQVWVALFDAAGVEIVSDRPFVALAAVPPGGRAPFSVLFSAPSANVADFQALVTRADEAYNYEARYAQLTVSDLQTKPEGSQYRVQGRVSNRGATAVNADLVITLYDDQGRVSGFRQFPLPDEQLAAGGSVAFNELVSPDPSAPRVANFSAVAQARTR